MDGDGVPDLIVQNYATFTVFFNNGDGTFSKTSTYPGQGIRFSELLDENGDGRLDIIMAVHDNYSTWLHVLYNTCE